MRIGITCYPTFGGSGVVATELGIALARGGDDVHFMIPHAISAHLAKQILGSTRLKVITTLHGTDITLVGRDASYLPITKFGIEVSDGVTAVSRWLRDETEKNFDTKKEIAVIPNFVDPARFQRHGSAFCHLFGDSDDRMLCHVSNFRPVKRIMDVLA